MMGIKRITQGRRQWLRVVLYEKFGGKCAYCGVDLPDNWQIDHMNSVYEYSCGLFTGDPHHIDNLVPCHPIINHYKRSLSLEGFREYMSDFHKRLSKLPKNPICERSINRKVYMQTIADLFNIKKDVPFTGRFYFELCGQNNT